MSARTSNLSLLVILRQYFPKSSFDALNANPNSDIDGVVQASNAVYTQIAYDANEKVDIERWIREFHRTATSQEDTITWGKRLNSLNNHLSSRTTLLGTKPSIADAVLYSSLAPLIRDWTSEERTGQDGYHHIVRYIDFVQNSAKMGLSISADDKVVIDPCKVIVMPKLLDSKEDKERKKKEKAASSGEVSGSPDTLKQQEQKRLHLADKNTMLDTSDSGKSVELRNLAAKKNKKEKPTKSPNQPAKEIPLTPALIDLRVGHILKAVTHPNADSLFVSTIAVGDVLGTENTSVYEGQVVRTVCSGLNGLVPLEEMQNRKIVAVCNLKPVTMRGVKSTAMVLAASPHLPEGTSDSHAGPVELVSPPGEAAAGQRIIFEGWAGQPEPVLNPKKKIWESCQVGFTTTENLDVVFEKARVEQLSGDSGIGKPGLGRLVVENGGLCKVKSLVGAVVR